MQNLDDYVWVFIGCGGTFYAASPYLAVLRKKYPRYRTILIDPDVIETGNDSRQWPHHKIGSTKVHEGAQCIGESFALEISDRFDSCDTVLSDATDGMPVLAIVNVDNDQCRLDVANWLASRVSPGIMVVSGCERTHGQCYPGIWMDGQPVFDWREHHPDVGKGGPPQGQCNAQNIRANALTGVLVGMCVEDVAKQYDFVREFYWDIEGGRVRMWSCLARCQGVTQP